jgi:hypothetical protein
MQIQDLLFLTLTFFNHECSNSKFIAFQYYEANDPAEISYTLDAAKPSAPETS